MPIFLHNLEPCLQFKLERTSEHAIQFYKLSLNFKRPVFDKWTMLRNWVHWGGLWTGSKEVVHGPGPKGWSMDLGSMFCIRPLEDIL